MHYVFDTSQTYLYFLMLHACFTPIALCFITILWHFYTISDTNLLTRCHGASSLLSAIFGFRKVTQEIFSELDETKAETPIFPEHSRTPKERCSRTRREPHLPLARLASWPHHGGCGPPPGPATPSFRL